MNTEEIKLQWNKWRDEADPLYSPNPKRLGIGVGKVMKSCSGDDILRKQVVFFLAGKKSIKLFDTSEAQAWIKFCESANMSEMVRAILDDIHPQLLSDEVQKQADEYLEAEAEHFESYFKDVMEGKAG